MLASMSPAGSKVGSDTVGEIIAVGADVRDREVGQRVAFMTFGLATQGGDGSFAEQAVVRAPGAVPENADCAVVQGDRGQDSGGAVWRARGGGGRSFGRCIFGSIVTNRQGRRRCVRRRDSIFTSLFGSQRLFSLRLMCSPLNRRLPHPSQSSGSYRRSCARTEVGCSALYASSCVNVMMITTRSLGQGVFPALDFGRYAFPNQSYSL